MQEKRHVSAIIAAIELADIAIYLISPSSVKEGAYTRSELRLMSVKWPVAEDRLISVLPRNSPVSMQTIPAYAKSVSVLRPEGNVVPEVLQQVRRIALKLRPRYRLDVTKSPQSKQHLFASTRNGRRKMFSLQLSNFPALVV